MKRVILVFVIAFGTAIVLAQTSTTVAWAGCGGKGEDPCPPPSNEKEKEKKQPKSPTAVPTATFTATPEPTATATSVPTETSTPIPTSTTVAVVVAAGPGATIPPQPRCWAWLGFLVAGSAYLLTVGLRRVSQVNEVAVRGYDTNRRREITGRNSATVISSMSLAEKAALYASGLLALAGAFGLILAAPCTSSLPAAAGAGGLGIGLAVIGGLPLLPRSWLGGTESGGGSAGPSGPGSLDLSRMSIEDAVTLMFMLLSNDAREDTREVLGEMDAERRRRAEIRTAQKDLRGDRLTPAVPTMKPADEDVRYTLFLPDGTPARDTVHVATKNPSKTSSKPSSRDTSSDADGDGDAS